MDRSPSSEYPTTPSFLSSFLQSCKCFSILRNDQDDPDDDAISPSSRLFYAPHPIYTDERTQFTQLNLCRFNGIFEEEKKKKKKKKQKKSMKASILCYSRRGGVRRILLDSKERLLKKKEKQKKIGTMEGDRFLRNPWSQNGKDCSKPARDIVKSKFSLEKKESDNNSKQRCHMKHEAIRCRVLKEMEMTMKCCYHENEAMIGGFMDESRDASCDSAKQNKNGAMIGGFMDESRDASCDSAKKNKNDAIIRGFMEESRSASCDSAKKNKNGAIIAGFMDQSRNVTCDCAMKNKKDAIIGGFMEESRDTSCHSAKKNKNGAIIAGFMDQSRNASCDCALKSKNEDIVGGFMEESRSISCDSSKKTKNGAIIGGFMDQSRNVTCVCAMKNKNDAIIGGFMEESRDVSCDSSKKIKNGAIIGGFMDQSRNVTCDSARSSGIHSCSWESSESSEEEEEEDWSHRRRHKVKHGKSPRTLGKCETAVSGHGFPHGGGGFGVSNPMINRAGRTHPEEDHTYRGFGSGQAPEFGPGPMNCLKNTRAWSEFGPSPMNCLKNTRAWGNCIPMVKYSYRAYEDFYESMSCLVVRRRSLVKQTDLVGDLKDLFACYLLINSPMHHHLIEEAFVNLLTYISLHANGPHFIGRPSKH